MHCQSTAGPLTPVERINEPGQDVYLARAAAGPKRPLANDRYPAMCREQDLSNIT